MLQQWVKDLIVLHLRMVDLRNINGITLGIKFFLRDVESKTNEDYLDVISSLQQWITGNEAQAVRYLGMIPVAFFKSLQFNKTEKDNIQHRLTQSMMVWRSKMRKIAEAVLSSHTPTYAAGGTLGSATISENMSFDDLVAKCFKRR